MKKSGKKKEILHSVEEHDPPKNVMNCGCSINPKSGSVWLEATL